MNRPQRLWAAPRIGALALTSMVMTTVSTLGMQQAWADAKFPVATTLQQLRGRTQVPVLLPSVALGGFARLSEANAKRYSISFDMLPNCGGTPCNAGEISATRGGQFSDLKEFTGPRSSTAKVKLKNGTLAQFMSGCGAYCSAVLEWKTGDVLYSVYVKNGQLKDTVAIANSAVSAGIRSIPQRAVLAYPVGAKVELTNPGGFSIEKEPINIRDRATTQSNARHIGYAEDKLTILDRATGPDNYGWYKVKFEVSGATGWVREDFVVNSLSADELRQLQGG